MATKAFDKFINKPVSGAKKKEIIRQEKKKAKRELREAIEESKRRKRLQQQDNTQQSYPARKPSADFRDKKIKGDKEKFSSPPAKKFVQKDEKKFQSPERKITVQKPEKYKRGDDIKEKKKFSGDDKKVKSSKPNTSSKQIETPAPANDVMPLNKYIAHCGVCGRREAAELVKTGKVKVNNEII